MYKREPIPAIEHAIALTLQNCVINDNRHARSHSDMDDYNVTQSDEEETGIMILMDKGHEPPIGVNKRADESNYEERDDEAFPNRTHDK